MIDDFFSAKQLGQSLSGFEDRPQQRRIASAVARAFEFGGGLIAEAGTGTGKSLAYLAPALESGKKVVVSTATRSLQDQLLRKELPVLQSSAFAESKKITVLKGTSNYLCIRKYRSARYSAEDTPQWRKVKQWAAGTESGELSELGFAEGDPIFSLISTSSESRIGPRCPYYEDCFITKARRRAEDSDLVVVNHHLFFSDLALRQEEEGARVLPDYEAVVFDEAHGLEEIIASHFSVEVSSARIELLLRDWKNFNSKAPKSRDSIWIKSGQAEIRCKEVALASEEFFAMLRHKLGHLATEADSDRFALPEEWLDEEIRDAWYNLDNQLEELYAVGNREATRLRDDGMEERGEEARVLSERCARFRDDLAVIADRELDRGTHVYWVGFSAKQTSLCASPVEVDGLLQKRLLPKLETWIFTSATLSAGGSFDHFRIRLGMRKGDADEISVDSPFDYKRQCLLYLPRDIPESKEIDKESERHARIAELIALTEGHALVLFTSYRAMESCFRGIKSKLQLPLLMQGQAPRSQLLEQFQNNPQLSLLATNSFWEGVDVPGKSLSHVIIDKLPFEVPSDPLIQARMRRLEEQGLSPFAHYQLPRAAISFRQGFGRLIRRKGDRGIVSVLDPRIVNKAYGRFFLNSLPPVPRTSVLHQVRRFWSDGKEGPEMSKNG